MMDGDIAMSPEAGPSQPLIPSTRPTTADSLNSFTMQNGTRRARSASTSSSATNFPSSHDAFGLAASPSAHSPKHSWLATRPNAFPPGWAIAGGSGGGGGIVGGSMGMMMTTGQGEGARSMMQASFLPPPPDLILPSPTQHSQSHGVLPSSSLMGGSNMRLSRPSLLSLETTAQDEDYPSADQDPKRDHATIEEENPEDIEAEAEADMDGTAAEAVNRWRNRLEPSPTIRRVQSACGTPRSGNQSPFSLHASGSTHHVGLDQGNNSGGSGSDSPTRGSRIRRASMDQTSGGRNSSDDFKSMLDGIRRDANGMVDSARMDEGSGMGRGVLGRGKNKGKGKEKMSFSSAGSGGSGEGESSRRASAAMDGKRPSARLPPNLRATLAAEKDIAGQEIRSEALLQRLILSNPSSLPMTPRPSRYHRNRAMSTFSSAQSQSSDSMSGNSSDDEGPFPADDLVERDVTPAIEPGWSAGMEVDVMTPVGMGGSGGGGGPTHDTPGQQGTVPLQGENGYNSRRGPSGRSSMNSLNSFGGMKVDEKMESPVGNSMSWRESPSSSTRNNKRKAAFEESRYEPYGKRPRGSTSESVTSGNSTTGGGGNNGGLGHSPLQWPSTLPTVPMSPMSTTGSASAMDFDTPGRSHPRSRAGSPGLGGMGPVQMMSRSSASPATSSPLNHHNPPFQPNATTNNLTFTHAPPGSAGYGGRPMVGMGGLGMLLLSKRNANAMSTGMGLIKTGGEGDNESAVAERMGGMDFAGGGKEARREEEDEDGDKMMFD